MRLNLFCKTVSLICVAILICSSVSVAQTSSTGREDQSQTESSLAGELERQLKLAGDNRAELEKAIQSAPAKQVDAVKFLIRNMPKRDLKSLDASFLLTNVKIAHEVKAKSPWAAKIDQNLFLNDILPYANVDETREAWRAEMHERCWPIVKDCQTPAEAAQALNRELFRLVNVRYSTKRKKANQCPSESIEQGLASCTGLSILLVDACRSVHVPARLAGIPSWTNKRGNHTWVEIWSEGQWHFTGAAEYNSKGLNRAWFTGDAALADKSKPMNSIYAISFARTSTRFPMVWDRDRENAVYAVNVTDRYTPKKVANSDQSKIKVRVRVWNQTKTERIATTVTLLNEDGSEGISQTSKAGTADMNDMIEFELKRNSKRTFRVGEGNSKTIILETKDTATQLLEVQLNAK